MDIEKHPFEPFIPDSPSILFMGTFPPQPKRWSMEFYYPNWTNDFWRIMGFIFYSDKNHFCDLQHKTYRLDDIKEFLSTHNIAMWDSAMEVVRLKDNASDKFLDIRKPIDIKGMLNTYPSLVKLVTAGEKATVTISDLLGTTPPCMGGYTDFFFNGRRIRHYRMPSSSRAYPMSLDKKAAMYSLLFGKD